MPGFVTHGPEYMRRLGDETSTKDFPWKVAFVPGSATLAALCANGRLRLIPTQGGKERSVSVGTSATSTGSALAVAPGGDFVLAGKFYVDAATGKKVWTAKTMAPHAAVITADGKTTIAGCYRLSAATGKQTGYLLETDRCHVGSILALAISRDGETLASGDSTGNVALTTIASGTVLAGGSQDTRSTTRGFFRSVNVLAFGRDCLAVGGDGWEVRLLSLRDLALVRTLPVCSREPATSDSRVSPEMRGLAFAPDGLTLVAASNDPDRRTPRAHVQVWNAETGEERMRVSFADRLPSQGALALSSDGATIAVALSTGTYVCDLPHASPDH
jgi:WD40 repeat protein